MVSFWGSGTESNFAAFVLSCLKSPFPLQRNTMAVHNWRRSRPIHDRIILLMGGAMVEARWHPCELPWQRIAFASSLQWSHEWNTSTLWLRRSLFLPGSTRTGNTDAFLCASKTAPWLLNLTLHSGGRFIGTITFLARITRRRRSSVCACCINR